MKHSVLAAVFAAVFVLAGCGGANDDSGESGTESTPAQSSSAEGTPSANACRAAMITSLSRAYAEAAKEPDKEARDLAFAAAAGELPSECRLLPRETLQTLLQAAKDVAIPPG